MAESVGTFDKLWLSADDSTYLAYEFLDGSSLALQEQFLDPNGIRGVRGHQSERVARGTRQTGGTLLFNPTPVELDTLLPWILGAAEATDTFALAETVPARYARTSRDGVFHLYNGLKVQQAVFSASEGGLMQLSVTVQGIDEATSTAPTGPPTIADDIPYTMHDSALTVAATTYAFGQASVSIDNGLETRFRNSATPSSIHATDRVVQFSAQFPYGDASALYGAALAGVAVVWTFTSGSQSLVFTMPAVQTPKQGIPLGGRRARDLPWTGIARRSGSTQELTVTSDST